MSTFQPGDSRTVKEIFIVVGLAILSLIAYLLYAGFTGYLKSAKSPCQLGYRAINVDGSASINPAGPGQLVTPNADFPICAPTLSCPVDGEKYAIHRDGSAQTNSCEEANCRCTIFPHCPAYVNTVFRQYGSDERISLFQVVDPMVIDPLNIKDPFDPPYLFPPGSRDTCMITEAMRQTVWEKLELGEPCLRGTLAIMSDNRMLMACVPSGYVDEQNVFQVETYLAAYSVAGTIWSLPQTKQ